MIIKEISVGHMLATQLEVWRGPVESYAAQFGLASEWARF